MNDLRVIAVEPMAAPSVTPPHAAPAPHAAEEAASTALLLVVVPDSFAAVWIRDRRVDGAGELHEERLVQLAADEEHAAGR